MKNTLKNYEVVCSACGINYSNSTLGKSHEKLHLLCHPKSANAKAVYVEVRNRRTNKMQFVCADKLINE